MGAASRGLLICQKVSGVRHMVRRKNEHGQRIGAGQERGREHDEGALELHIFGVWY